MMFKQAPEIQPRLADDVYDQILSAIVNGQIEPGERLIQEKIAAQINISRTPVREALLRLEQDGILEQTGRKGFSIRQISSAEVHNLYGAREAVEGYAAYLVAEAAEADQLAAIKTAVDEELSLKKRDVEAEFRINRNIHRTIVAQTGNPILMDMFNILWGRGLSLWLFAATRSNETPPDPDIHLQLYTALSAGDPRHAQDAMIQHIRDGLAMHLKGL